jgi:hypothetical protein
VFRVDLQGLRIQLEAARGVCEIQGTDSGSAKTNAAFLEVLGFFPADPLRFLENECRGRDLIPLAYLPSLVLHSVLIRFFK